MALSACPSRMPPPAGKLKHCQLKRCQVAASSHRFSARQRGPTRPSGGGAAAQTGSSWGSKHEFASRCGVWTETHPVLGDNLLDDVCQRHSKVLNALAGREPDLRLSRLPPLAPRLLALGIARRHLPRHRHCRQQFTPSMLVSSPMCNLAVTAGFVTSRPLAPARLPQLHARQHRTWAMPLHAWPRRRPLRRTTVASALCDRHSCLPRCVRPSELGTASWASPAFSTTFVHAAMCASLECERAGN